MYKEISVSSWGDYQEVIESLISKSNLTNFLFRGQSKFSRSLKPSFLHNLKHDISSEKAFDLERQFVYQFRQEAHQYLKATVMPPDLEYLTAANIYIKWLSLMQHHGAPTRLLDWSSSSYVALYFAVVDRWENDGAVWYFDNFLVQEYYQTQDLDFTQKKTEEFLGAEPTRTLYTGEAKLKSKREIAQQGGFSFSSDILTTHDELISKACNREKSDIFGFAKIKIPAELKPGFLFRLRKMNITAKTLFPGVDGIGKYLKNDVRLHFN